MSSNVALPPWLLKAVEEAGTATVILKAGDRPYVIRSKAPYHLGTQPLTNLALEALAQQILSDDAQQALYDGENVQETLNSERTPVNVRAVRMDHDIVIRLRAQAAVNAAVNELPPLPANPAAESVTVLINRQTLALNEGQPVLPAAPTTTAVAEPPVSADPPADPPAVEPSATRKPFVVQSAGGAVIVETAGGQTISEIELPTGPEGLDTFISKIGPGTPSTSAAAADASQPISDAGVEAAAPVLDSVHNSTAPQPDENRSSQSEQHVAERTEELEVATTATAQQRTLDVANATLSDWIGEALRRGATALYLRVGYVPAARIEGRVETLSSDALPLSMFEQAGPSMAAGEDGWRDAGEWTWAKEIPDTGMIRCQAFSDAQGGGFIVHLPVFVPGLDQLVPRHIRTACEAGEGLILISAPFAEDVAAMVGAVLGWTAKRRAGFVVAFGFDGGLQGVAGDSFVSARRIPSNREEMTSALQSALGERPDTLVFLAEGTLPAADAIVSAAVGRLVIVGVVARTAPLAVEALLNDMPGDRRALANVFRAACSWRGFRRPGAEHVVVSDVLVASESVNGLIEAADIGSLHNAQASEQNSMRTLDTALASAATRGKISLREAAAAGVDRKTLVSLVRRQAWERRRTTAGQ